MKFFYAYMPQELLLSFEPREGDDEPVPDTGFNI